MDAGWAKAEGRMQGMDNINTEANSQKGKTDNLRWGFGGGDIHTKFSNHGAHET